MLRWWEMKLPDIIFNLSGPVPESDGKAEQDKTEEEAKEIDHAQNEGNQSISSDSVVLIENKWTAYPVLQKWISSLVF